MLDKPDIISVLGSLPLPMLMSCCIWRVLADCSQDRSSPGLPTLADKARNGHLQDSKVVFSICIARSSIFMVVMVPVSQATNPYVCQKGGVAVCTVF